MSAADQDAQLMGRAAEGDDAAFGELFERYYARAVNIAYRCLGNRDLAEDAAMDAFLRVYESRSRYNPTAKFSTFLYRVVGNVCLNVARRAKTVQYDDLDQVSAAAAGDSGPAQHAEQAETARAVRTALLKLPTNQRMAIVLTRYEQMSYADAADAMSVSVKALESLLHRAKQKLRRLLADLIETE